MKPAGLPFRAPVFIPLSTVGIALALAVLRPSDHPIGLRLGLRSNLLWVDKESMLHVAGQAVASLPVHFLLLDWRRGNVIKLRAKATVLRANHK